VDEVGRGCLAGPVVTAAVVLPRDLIERETLSGGWEEVTDSKLLSPKTRERLAAMIEAEARVRVAWCDVAEIDRWNILNAALEAMRRALGAFAGEARAVLVDGHMSPYDPRYRCPPGEAARLGFDRVELLVKGDRRSLSIAAASVVAKVYRDRWMARLDAEYPGYGFAGHKGYCTAEHYRAIEALGPCALHRMSFAPFASAR
jgi:ribonuclease HII